jgi:hypothetical protein
MSDYQPPRENVPIFDSTLFGPRGGNLDTSGGGGGGGLTKEEMDELYLQWPQSQASGETFNGTTILTNTLSVGGATTLQSTGSVALDLTLGQDILMTGVGSYLRFPNGDQQTTGFSILNPDPSGTYVNANIIVNTYGQITTASNDTVEGRLISRQVLTTATVPVDTSYNVVVPAGCRTMEVILCGSGGVQGNNFLDTATDTMYPGGSGASGSMAVISVEIGPGPYSFPGNLFVVGFLSNTNPQNPTVKLAPVLAYTQVANTYFGATYGQTPAPGVLPICFPGNQGVAVVASGTSGGNASLGVSGAGGINSSIANQISISPINNSFSTIYAQGQNGQTSPPIPNYSNPNTLYQQPYPTCPMADFSPISTTLFPLIRGGNSTYSAGTVYPNTAGTGGIVISFFT